MLHVLMTRGDKPLPPKEARELLNAMAQEFDTNFDGKFSYSGKFEVAYIHLIMTNVKQCKIVFVVYKLKIISICSRGSW